MRTIKYFIVAALFTGVFALATQLLAPLSVSAQNAITCPGGVAPSDGFCPATVIAGSAGAGCKPKGTVLGLPTWYRHLDGQIEQPNPDEASTCQIKINGLTDVWKIVAALIEALLRIASLVAIGFVVFGGVTYMTSQGAPDKTKAALSTIISALVGLTITIVASAIVGFIAGRF